MGGPQEIISMRSALLAYLSVRLAHAQLPFSQSLNGNKLYLHATCPVFNLAQNLKAAEVLVERLHFCVRTDTDWTFFPF